eukprot:TRINITY_DN7857_c0_g1_i1.p1 TRINITY_DN7857_c0_g1~~TRINITY_DN7857_c0_g1_i1.p1  ORF type:complete len:466 (+),score=90.01 TRINITY_DN7857_c0_g1_i1:45-1400(+)
MSSANPLAAIDHGTHLWSPVDVSAMERDRSRTPMTAMSEEQDGMAKVVIELEDGTDCWDGHMGSFIEGATADSMTDPETDTMNEELGEYGADKILMALELLVPKTMSHIWMVREIVSPTRLIEVFTPNSFEEFVKLAFPNIKTRWPGSYQWVDFQGLTDNQVRTLGAMLFLHELTIEDIIEDCPEKLEQFEEAKYHYAVLYGHNTTANGWEEVKISCIITHGWVITIHKTPFLGLDEVLKRVRKDLFKKIGYKSLRGMWLYYCLFDVAVDTMMRRVSRCCENANYVDELVLQLWEDDGQPEMSEATRMIARTRKQINALRRYYVSKDAIIKEHKLYKKPHFRDVHDHVQQMLDKLESARDILAQANSNYLAGISVRASMTANSTNEAMRKMSLLAFVFVPMTLITSLFGMNVEVPWQHENSLIPFWLILATFVATPVCLIIAMKCCHKTKH